MSSIDLYISAKYSHCETRIAKRVDVMFKYSMGLHVKAVNYVDLRVEMLLPYQRLRQIREAFLGEMMLAQEQGGTSHIPYLVNHLPEVNIVPRGEKVCALTVGGSNYNLVQGQSPIELETDSVNKKGMVTAPLPRFDDKESFLEFIETVLPDNTNWLGLNFAYPLVPESRDGLLDGRLVRGTKEHAFTGLLGESIGRSISEYFANKHGRKLNVSVANDTICLLLAGLKLANKETLLAGVIGTGSNFGLFSRDGNAVNLESGFFSKLELSNTGKIVDRNSSNPGESLIEKEISGAYLYKHYNIVVETYGLNYPSIDDSARLTEIIINKLPGMEIAEILLERSAAITATMLAAIYQFQKQPKLTAVMEGSLFWQGYNYKQWVEKYLLQLGVPEYNYTTNPDSGIEFVHIDNSSVLGAINLLQPN